MRKYVNTTNIPLAMSVFLAHDDYDHEASAAENTISVTTLLKPTKQIILTKRMDFTDVGVNLEDNIANRIGNAIHNGIETSWANPHKALKALGHSDSFIESVIVNPEEGVDLTNKYPIYTEIRSSRAHLDYNITGKFDFAVNGSVEDFKTTSVWTAIYKRSDDYYIKQLSLYRWLNQNIIDKDYSTIHWIFTDWSKAQSYSNPDYPKSRYEAKRFSLMSEQDTENFLTMKLSEISMFMDVPQDQIPRCTDEELWRSKPVYKYYKNPLKTARATKNFNTELEAMQQYAEDHFVGMVVTVPGKVKACRYCPAFLICEQKDEYIASGDLEL